MATFDVDGGPMAIVIGIGAYRREEQANISQLPEVRGCEAAAHAVVDYMLDKSKTRLNPRNIHLFDTSGANEYRTLKITSPTENNIKELFEGGLAEFANADPLIIYWCGHGALAQSDDDSRRLFFCDSSNVNWRNLKLESVIRRLSSRESKLRSLLIVVDACAVTAISADWPDGKIIGGKARDANQLPFVAFFSARPGQSAQIPEQGVGIPLYTSFLLANIINGPPHCPDLLAAVRKAHEQVTIDIDRYWEEAVAENRLDRKQLVAQMPFEILIKSDAGTAIYRPTMRGYVTDLTSALELAGYWAKTFQFYGSAFRSTKAQREMLRQWSDDLIKVEYIKGWWKAGEEWDRSTSRNKVIFLSLILISFLTICFFAVLYPAGNLVDSLRDTENVVDRMQSQWWLIRNASVFLLRRQLSERGNVQDSLARISRSKHQANCALALLYQNQTGDFLKEIDGQDEGYDPQLRTYVITSAVQPAGINSAVLLSLLKQQPSARSRQALILALGQEQVMLPSDKTFPREEFKSLLLDLYERDDDPGVHAAAWWCLRRKYDDDETMRRLADVAKGLRATGAERLVRSQGTRHWFIDKGTGLTMVVLLTEGKSVFVGDRDLSKGQSKNEVPYGRNISLRRSFAIAMTEANPSHLEKMSGAEISVEPGLSKLSQRQAQSRCNDLGIHPSSKHLRINGKKYVLDQFRLPDELEWEYACRGGSLAKYSFGDDSSLLRLYATSPLNSQAGPHLLATMPNDFGLFDMHGGLAEWCNNDYTLFPPDQENEILGSTKSVIRGGGGGDFVEEGRESFRRFPNANDNDWVRWVGFRPAVTVREDRQ